MNIDVEFHIRHNYPWSKLPANVRQVWPPARCVRLLSPGVSGRPPHPPAALLARSLGRAPAGTSVHGLPLGFMVGEGAGGGAPE